MRYIWQNPDWPNFTYDLSAIQSTLYNYARDISAISARIDETHSNFSTEATIDIIVSEAFKTSEIEGEHYSATNLRSSVRKILGFGGEAVADKKAASLSHLMIDSRNSFYEPLSEEMLFSWHKLLMQESNLSPDYISKWRYGADPMQIISGPIGNEKVHYEAPPSEIVPYEMQRFIDWFNRSEGLPGPIRSAIAHLYFEIIHPFEDGNGRVGRIIAEKALSQDLKMPVLLSISSEIMNDKKRYYDELSRASIRGLDITHWVHYFSSLLYNASLSSKNKIEFIIKKAKFWREFDAALNERQKRAIARIFAQGEKGFEGGISAKKYIHITGCSKATATRDLVNLLGIGALRLLSAGSRNTSYEVAL